MDDVTEHFGQYGDCTPVDWEGSGDLNVVPLQFEDAVSASLAREPISHFICDQRGRRIKVTVGS